LKGGSLAALGAGLAPGAARTQPRRPPAGQSPTAPAPATAAELQRFIPELMSHTGVPGLSIAVIRDAKIVWRQGFGVRNKETGEPVTTETAFSAASFSKAAFAYATLRLVERGRLDLDKPLWDYRPNYFLPAGDPRSKLITARMILSHTSGLHYRTDDKLTKIYTTPGEKWFYSPQGYGYLQRIVEHVTGQPVAEFMRANLLEPFGMTESSYDWSEKYEREAAKGYDREGKPTQDFYDKFRGFSAEEKAKILAVQPEDAAPGAGFSLYSTPTDYARFLVEIMRPARRGDFHLSERMAAEMLKPQIRVAYSLDWGLGWEVEHGEAGDAFYHYGNSGHFQSIAVAHPPLGRGVVVMTNSANGLKLIDKLAPLALGTSSMTYLYTFA
jgi:CubicO group peptidase (beta-lactamase class C family)